MAYILEIPPEDLQAARETLERLVNALFTQEDAETVAAIIHDLQANHEAAAYLLARMLNSDSRRIS